MRVQCWHLNEVHCSLPAVEPRVKQKYSEWRLPDHDQCIQCLQNCAHLPSVGGGGTTWTTLSSRADTPRPSLAEMASTWHDGVE